MTGDDQTRIDLLLGLRRFREAEALARECLAAEPEWAGGYCQLARALAGQDRPDEALHAAHSAARLTPDQPWVLAILAWIQLGTGQLDGARDTLRQVLRLNPNYSWGHQLLAITYEKLGLGSERLAAARKAVELAPEDESPWVQLGWALLAEKKHAEAAQIADDALKQHPESAALHNLRGCCWKAEGEQTCWPRHFRSFRKAHDALREAVRLDPGEPAYASNLLANSVVWRQISYQWVVLTGLPILWILVYGLGYLFIGHYVAIVVGFLILLALIFREGIQNPPDYGLAMLPLDWMGVPSIPLAPEDRSQGRRDWMVWVGGILLGLLFMATYIAIRAGISSAMRR